MTLISLMKKNFLFKFLKLTLTIQKKNSAN